MGAQLRRQQPVLRGARRVRRELALDAVENGGVTGNGGAVLCLHCRRVTLAHRGAGGVQRRATLLQQEEQA